MQGKSVRRMQLREVWIIPGSLVGDSNAEHMSLKLALFELVMSPYLQVDLSPLTSMDSETRDVATLRAGTHIVKVASSEYSYIQY